MCTHSNSITYTEIHEYNILTLLPLFDPFTPSAWFWDCSTVLRILQLPRGFPAPRAAVLLIPPSQSRPPLADTAGTQQTTGKKHNAKCSDSETPPVLLGGPPFSSTQTIPGTKFVPQRRDRRTAQGEPQQLYIACSVLTPPQTDRQTDSRPLCFVRVVTVLSPAHLPHSAPARNGFLRKGDSST